MVKLVGVELRGGHAELGAGVRVTGWSTVRLEDCAVGGNRPVQGGSGGLGVSAGHVTAVRVRFAADAGLLLTGASEVELDACEVLGEARVREGAQVKIIDSTIARLDVRGTTTRTPTVDVRGATIREPVVNDDEQPGTITGLDE
jgi:hypothetical protein